MSNRQSLENYSTSRQKDIENRLSENVDLVTSDADGKVQNRGASSIRKGSETRIDAWRWVVMLSAFVIHVFFPMLATFFGILYAHKVESLSLSSSVVTWIINLFGFVWNMVGLITGPLCAEFGERPVAVFGCLLASLSLLASVFAHTTGIIVFLFVLMGGGCGLAFTVCHLILPLYFSKRRRGLPMGFIMTGVSVGQFVLPLFIRFLQASFGFHGASLVFSAFISHSVVVALLFHPVRWHRIRKRYDVDVTSSSSSPSAVPAGSLLCHGSEEDLTDNKLGSEDNVTVKDICKGSEDNVTAINHGSEESVTAFKICKGSEEDVTAINLLRKRSDENVTAIKPSKKSKRNTLRSIMSSIIVNIVSLRSPVVLILALSVGSYSSSFLNFVLMVPFAMTSQGHTLQTAAYCISVAAIGSLVARIIVPAASDIKGFHRGACYVLGHLTIGISIFAFTLVEEVPHIMASMALYGFGVGTSMGLQMLILADYNGDARLPVTIGAASFMSAIIFIVTGPFVGFIRDLSDSYVVSNRILSGLSFFSVFMWFFMPFAQSHQKLKK